MDRRSTSSESSAVTSLRSIMQRAGFALPRSVHWLRRSWPSALACGHVYAEVVPVYDERFAAGQA